MKASDSPAKIRWLKRALAAGAILVWFALIVSIFRSGGGMADQAPKCLFSTMIVFGILTLSYKGIEKWEASQREEE
jgi:hypothetical protein